MRYNITIQQHVAYTSSLRYPQKKKKISNVRSDEWEEYSTKPLLPIHLSDKTSSKKTTKYHAGNFEVPNLAQLK